MTDHCQSLRGLTTAPPAQFGSSIAFFGHFPRGQNFGFLVLTHSFHDSLHNVFPLLSESSYHVDRILVDSIKSLFEQINE
jgi:hypothetical protein